MTERRVYADFVVNSVKKLEFLDDIPKKNINILLSKQLTAFNKSQNIITKSFNNNTSVTTTKSSEIKKKEILSYRRIMPSAKHTLINQSNSFKSNNFALFPVK